MGFWFALGAAKLNVGAEDVATFGVSATEEFGGGGVFGNEGWDFGGVDVGEVAVGAEVAGGAGEPNEAATCVENEGFFILALFAVFVCLLVHREGALLATISYKYAKATILFVVDHRQSKS